MFWALENHDLKKTNLQTKLPKNYIHFITLGVGEGRYVDLVVDKPVKYARDSVVVGEGQMWTKDNSNYLKVKRKNVRAMPIDQYA